MLTFETHACTDITGFGFAGHASIIARQSKVSLEINNQHLSVYPPALEGFKNGERSAASKANRLEYESSCCFHEKVPDYIQEILFDPQTSGGLLIAASEKDAPKLLTQLLVNGEIAAAVGKIIARGQTDIIIT